jgi:hypothetical protein
MRICGTFDFEARGFAALTFLAIKGFLVEPRRSKGVPGKQGRKRRTGTGGE